MHSLWQCDFPHKKNGEQITENVKKEIIASVEATSTCITIAGICTSGTCKERKKWYF